MTLLKKALLVLVGVVPLLQLGCSTSDPKSTASDPSGRAAQAVIATDLVTEGTFDAGVNYYRSTLPPETTVGVVAQTLEASWDPAAHFISEPPVYPQGWTLDYYVGATKLSSPPNTAAGFAAVSRLVASGATNIEGLDGERQAMISTIVAPKVVLASSFSGGSAGDGWDVFFDPQYKHVFNVHHHDGPATMMCRNLSDSLKCSNAWPITLSRTPSRATARVDEISNKVWNPTSSGGKLAWDCTDLSTWSRCATPVVLSIYPQRDTGYDNHADPAIIGRKLYSLGRGPGVSRITCLDMATGAECQGVQLPSAGSFEQASLTAVGARLFTIAGANTGLDCYESSTMTRCAGTWPVTGLRGPAWGVPSADGIMRNVCVDSLCYSLDGTAHTLPPNFIAYLASNKVIALSYTGIQYGKATSLNTKAAWVINANRVACWDLATDAKCAPAFPVGVQSMYAPTLDPEDSDCLWTNGDDGVIRNFKMSTGALGCGGGPAKITFKASIAIPRLGCDPTSRVYQYKSFKLVAPSPSDYTSASLTVKNSVGIPIPGFINLPIPSATQTIDLSTLTVATAGSSPSFEIVAPGFVNTAIDPVGEFRITTGSTPQLCWSLAPPSPVCPSTAGVAGNAIGVAAATPVVAKGSFTLAGGSVSQLTDQTLTPSVSTDPPNATNCGGGLSALVQTASNAPVGGVVVSLLDGAGSPILVGGLPVTAVTAANGTATFSVWAASYRLQIASAAAYDATSMTVTSGGSGTTNAAAGVVTSGQVDVLRIAPGSVRVVVTSLVPLAPTVSAPAAAALLTTATPTVQGTCLTGATVEVVEAGNVLCSAVCVASSFSCVSATLGEGAHTLAVHQTDIHGTSPDVTRSFSIDSVAPLAPSIAAPVAGALLAITNPTISGSCETGATVHVVEGPTAICTTACVAAAFSCPSLGLAQGSHALTAWQADVAGNNSVDSAPASFTIDSIAPAVPTVTRPGSGSSVSTAAVTVTGGCETDAAVTVSEGATVLCTATCLASSFSCTTPALTEGSHTLATQQTDAALNASASAAAVTFSIDVTAPVVPVISAPVDGLVTQDATPDVSGTCETGTTVKVYEGAVVLCSAPCAGGAFVCTASTLTDGPHALVVRQIDAAGNVSVATDAVNLTIDTLAPLDPAVTAPVAGSSTSDTTPAVAGTCETNATVKVYEGVTLLCTTVCTGGIFSCDSALLSDASHTLVARQTDPASNVSPISAGHTFIVDSTLPDAPVILSPTFAFTSDAAPTVSGSCETGATVKVYDSATAVCTTPCVAGAFSCVVTTLSEGVHTLVARQSDVAGNPSSNSNAKLFTVDHTAPTAAVILSPLEGASTAETAPSLAGRCEPFANVKVMEGVSVLCDLTCQASGLFICDLPVLADGPHTMVVQQTDQANNTAPASQPRSFSIDTASPGAASMMSPRAGASLKSSTPAFSGSCETGAMVSVYEGTTRLCEALCSAGAYVCTSLTLADGIHTVTVKQVDSAGNASTSTASRSFVIDTVAPEAVVIATPAQAAVINASVVTVSGSCESQAMVSVHEGAALRCESACVAGQFSCDTEPLTDGTHVLVAQQTDAAGNASPDTAPRTFRVDTGAPGAPMVLAPVEGAQLSDAQPSISGTCETGASVRVFEGTTGLCVTTCVNGVFSCSALLSQGKHTVIAKQTDVAGNLSAASAARSFTVDTLAPATPVVSSPASAAQNFDSSTVFAGSAEPGSTVTVTVNGNTACSAVSDAQGRWTCTATLSSGSQSVTAIAVDLASNASSNSAPVLYNQMIAIVAPAITSPANGTTEANGPQITVAGTAQAGSVVVIRDDNGVEVCTATADQTGHFECTGTTSGGQRTLTATSTFKGFKSESQPSATKVLTGSSFSGGGCSAAPTNGPNWMLLFAAALFLARKATASKKRVVPARIK